MTPETANVISQSFSKFKDYWISNKAFTVDLLTKLITDIYRLASKDGAKPDHERDAACVPFPQDLILFLEYAFCIYTIFVVSSINCF